MLCPLLAAALIDADGQKLPRRLITWPAAAGILLAFGIPAVQAVPLNFADHSASELASLWALANSAVGLIAAVSVRLIMLRLIGYQRPRELGLLSATLALYAVGAFLGWQARSGHRTDRHRLVAHAIRRAAKFFGPSWTNRDCVSRALVWCACERNAVWWIQSH